MEKRIWSRREVADFLTISTKTLANYGSRYAVYKPDHAGTFHFEHVQILVLVWARILTPDEGMDRWMFRKMHIRRSMLRVLPATGGVKKKGQREIV